MFSSVILTDLSNPKVYPFIKGRALWAAAMMSELLPKEDEFCYKLFECSVACLDSQNHIPIRLSACRSVVRYARKINLKTLGNYTGTMTLILHGLKNLLDSASQDTIHIPIEAITEVSKYDEEAVSIIAQEATGKLLELFQKYHNDGLIGPDLLNLFKIWCNYDKCLIILIETFVPFVMEIVKNYHIVTQNPKKASIDATSMLLDSSILQVSNSI